MKNEKPKMVSEDVFTQIDETDLTQRIVEEILNPNKNLETKTDLSKPLKWSLFDFLGTYTDSIEYEDKDDNDNIIMKKTLPKTTEFIRKFQEKSFILLISKDRGGRKEYVEALQSINNFKVENTENNPLIGN